MIDPTADAGAIIDPHSNGLSPKSGKASVGGASAGTGLVALAQSIGSDTILGALLLYLAPAISFTIGIGLYHAQIEVSVYRWKRSVGSARATLERQLSNPLTSADHKERLRIKLEALENSETSAELKRVIFPGDPSSINE